MHSIGPIVELSPFRNSFNPQASAFVIQIRAYWVRSSKKFQAEEHCYDRVSLEKVYLFWCTLKGSFLNINFQFAGQINAFRIR